MVLSFLFFWLLFGFSAVGFWFLLIIFSVSVVLAYSPYAEVLWRFLSGVRPLRLRTEKERLIPLFEEVYQNILNISPNTPRNIKLYIDESLDINAFAFGYETLIITRGALSLNDDCLKGLIAHELGHFTKGDTKRALVGAVSNLPMSGLMKGLNRIDYKLEVASKKTPFIGVFKFIFSIFFALFRFVDFTSNLISMSDSRAKEYNADYFAFECGYGEEMAGVLNEIYQMTIVKPESIKEQLKATHPPITKRIEELEKYL